METLKATQQQTPSIAWSDFAVEKKSKFDMARVSELLNRIANLNIEHFSQLSGSKFETAVQEMFAIIKDLEGQLGDVLAMNASLREELRTKQREKEELQQAKEAAEQKNAAFERDFPRMQDLERRLEITIEEVEKYRLLFRQEKEKLQKSEDGNRMLTALIGKAKEERDDAYKEIVVMADKLKSLTGTH